MPSSREALPGDELASGSDVGPQGRTFPTWLWRAVAGGALVLLAVSFGPDLLASSEKPPGELGATDLPTLPASRFASERPRAVAPLDWDVRGDLARDGTFLRAVLARVRQSEPAAAKVLFAARLPDGGRIAFVALARSDPVSDMGRGVHMRALHVPPDANPAEVKPVPIGRLMEDTDVTGWAGRTTGGRVFAAVLRGPEPLALEASALIRYSRNGGATRRWTPIDGADGSAVIDLGTRTDQLVLVRSNVPASRTYPLVLPVDHDPRARSGQVRRVPPVSRVAGLGERAYRGPAPRLVVKALAEGHEYRFDPETADLRILWSGQVERDRPAALVRARRPDGPVFQLLVVSVDDRVAIHGPRHVPWDEGDVTPWLFVQGDPEKPVLLLNPTGRGTAVMAEAGRPSRNVAIGADGVGVLSGTKQSEMFTGLSSARLAIVKPDGEIVVSSSLPSLGIDDVFVLR